MKTPIALIAVCLALTGCATTSKNVATRLADDLKEWEKLGVSEIVITGKFSHTDYTVEYKDGKRTATINHSNAWVPQIRVVRETATEDKE